MTDALIQFWLAGCGLVALWLATDWRPSWRRAAPVVGLCGQPAWLWFAWDAQAFGLLLLSLAYTVVYLRAAVIQYRPGTRGVE